jgi:hypothetical protein
MLSQPGRSHFEGLYRGKAEKVKCFCHKVKLSLKHLNLNGKDLIIMTTNSVHTVIQENVDPVLEAIIRGLVESRLHPESQTQPADTVTAALAQALLTSMTRQPVSPPPPQPELQIPPLVHALASALSATLASTLAATLAPALAAALSPTLANTLAPAIVEALTKTEQGGQQQPQAQGQQGQQPQAQGQQGRQNQQGQQQQPQAQGQQGQQSSEQAGQQQQ